MSGMVVSVPFIVCSCGTCDDDNQLWCDGKPFESKFFLKCDLHSLGYEIECETRTSKVDTVIHSTMGRGHTNPNLYQRRRKR